jgi:Werner syndrome ATP-dependent helicase
MPTRTETENLAAYFRRRGVKSMAYHSQLPKAHLKEVHELFHSDRLQVVIATIAFGMGIHKPNISHVIHYGWPQVF